MMFNDSDLQTTPPPPPNDMCGAGDPQETATYHPWTSSPASAIASVRQATSANTLAGRRVSIAELQRETYAPADGGDPSGARGPTARGRRVAPNRCQAELRDLFPAHSRAGRPSGFATSATVLQAREPAMTSKKRCSSMWVMAVVTAATAGLWPAKAQAQFGFGGGFGFGGFGGGYGNIFSQVPKPESFLSQKAIADSQRDAHIPSRDVYANNPISYISQVRDSGFVDRYEDERRDAAQYRAARRMETAAATQTAMRAAAQVPVLPLSSFYDPQNELMWPGDAPTAGDLKEKRSTFDQASQQVLAEAKKNGVASIAAVTDARRKLLDYGRPGLGYLRSHATPRIADSYHLFLLSLYESLAQAANPPVEAAPARPANPSSG
jgi:hypothetical protein